MNPFHSISITKCNRVYFEANQKKKGFSHRMNDKPILCFIIVSTRATIMIYDKQIDLFNLSNCCQIHWFEFYHGQYNDEVSSISICAKQRPPFFVHCTSIYWIAIFKDDKKNISVCWGTTAYGRTNEMETDKCTITHRPFSQTVYM